MLACESFIEQFVEANPLGGVGIILTRGKQCLKILLTVHSQLNPDGGAEKLTELSGNSSDHINALRKRENRETRGDASLQNSLEMAIRSLM